jgi:hypothetical protein
MRCMLEVVALRKATSYIVSHLVSHYQSVSVADHKLSAILANLGFSDKLVMVHGIDISDYLFLLSYFAILVNQKNKEEAILTTDIFTKNLFTARTLSFPII